MMVYHYHHNSENFPLLSIFFRLVEMLPVGDWEASRARVMSELDKDVSAGLFIGGQV